MIGHSMALGRSRPDLAGFGRGGDLLRRSRRATAPTTTMSALPGGFEAVTRLIVEHGTHAGETVSSEQGFAVLEGGGAGESHKT